MALALALSARADLASAQGRGGRGGGGLNIPPLLITSPAYPDGGVIPSEYVGAMGFSPELNWTGGPENTQSFAIIFQGIDVSFRSGTDDVLHWILWNIPGTATGLPRGGISAGTVQGVGITGQNAYFGPGAPAGEPVEDSAIPFCF